MRKTKTITQSIKKLERNNNNEAFEQILKKERKFTINNFKRYTRRISEISEIGFLDESVKEEKEIKTIDFNLNKCDISLDDEDLVLIRESLSNSIFFKDVLTLEIM